MENQNNQNDKPADGYVQAPQQEAKSVLAELAEFDFQKKSGRAECGCSGRGSKAGCAAECRKKNVIQQVSETKRAALR